MTALAQAKMGGRYLANLVSMTAREDGYPAAARVGAHFLATEARKIPRVVRRAMSGSNSTTGVHPSGYSEEIIEALGELPVPFRSYRIEPDDFYAHVRSVGYPRSYAVGPVEEGGNRENKLLEYFFALEILDIQPDDVVIDVASEHSIFPSVVRETYGATVFRQDLIFPPGVHGDRIGGSAASMPVADQFADKLVLHNSIEHFEGSADTDFIVEAWRIVKPGGVVCIVPLFVSERFSILSDPLTDRRGIVWDPGAEVIELPWWHNRFGRFYDAAALEERVLAPARELGFDAEILHFDTITDVHPLATMYFALVLRKPE